MSGYCNQCDRAVYLEKGDTLACPVCAYPLSEQEPATDTA